MNFEFTSEQLDAANAFRDHLREKVIPLYGEGPGERMSFETIRAVQLALGKCGFLGMAFPSGIGAGKSVLEWTLRAESLARFCTATFLTTSASSVAAGLAVARHGAGDSLKHFAGPCATGEKIGALALNEAQSGSDLGAIATTAQRTATGWKLDGAKACVTNAPFADFFVISALTNEPEATGPSLFAVDAKALGLSVGTRIETMGYEDAAFADIALHGCEVAEGAMLGAPESAGAVLAEAVRFARLSASVGALGIGLLCLEQALEHARSRVVSKTKIIKHQEVSFKLAQMRMQTDVARTLIHFAAFAMDENAPDADDAVNCAKIQATEAATKIAHMTVQILGTQGYMRGTPAERLYRDARLGEMLWGTSEILRMQLAQNVLDKA
jgi:butyryl-CoA dehydrogenase